MSDDPVVVERPSEEVSICILNRPGKRNALSIGLMQQLCAHLKEIEEDKRIRILVLRGNGPVFSAGLDLNEVTDPQLGIESAGMVRQSLSAVYQARVTTIAMVHGAAMGGGAGLVAACDFAVAEEKTVIGFPEVRLGLIPAQVMTILVRKLRRADLGELLSSGEPIDAARALQIGLIHRLGNVEIECQKIMARVLRNAPGAMAKTKQLLDHLYSSRLQEDLEYCMDQHVKALKGEEAREGIRAFMEKRKPAWDK